MAKVMTKHAERTKKTPKRQSQGGVGTLQIKPHRLVKLYEAMEEGYATSRVARRLGKKAVVAAG